MKRILLPLLFLMVSLASLAIPPEHRLQTFLQPDGTQVQAYRHGQWRTDFFTTADGHVLVRGAGQGLYYAEPADGGLRATRILAHDLQHRTAEEQTYLAGATLDATEAARYLTPLKRLQGARRIIGSSTSDGLGSYGVSGVGAVPSLGDVKIPVIMVEFSDKKFLTSTTQTKMQRYYTEEGYADESGSVGSCRDYFVAQSGGMFRPDFRVVAKVTLGSSYAYYGSNDNADGYFDVTRDAVVRARAQGVDFTPFEIDGEVPLVSIFYAGPGEATGGDDDCLWPCEAEINATISGVKFRSCFVGNEIYGNATSTELQGIGVFCHEFGHALGLPDFYCTDYSHSAVTMGYWSIMCSGSYVPDGRARAPIGYTAYERSVLGWLNIPELTAADSVSLHPFGSTEGPNAVLIRNDANAREYFILENHQPGTWYPENFGRGLFVTHVTFNPDAWRYDNLNNDETKLRCTFVPGSGTKSGRSSSDLWPYGTHNALGPSTTPPMRLFNGRTLDKPIYKITVRDDSLVTFNYLDENFKGRTAGDLVSDATLSYRFVNTSQVEVVAKEDGQYAGDVVIPAYYVDGEYRYRVVGIADAAFADCPALTGVSVPSTVTTVAPTAFRGSTALQGVSVDTANATLYSQDGILFSRSEMITSPETAVLPLTEDQYYDFGGNPWQFDVATNRLRTANGRLTDSIIVNNVTLVGIDATDAKYLYMLQGSDGTCSLVVPADCALRLSAPQGITITSARLTAPSGSPAFSASVGTLADTLWTGNTRELILTATANTSLATLNVTTVAARDYAEPVLYYFPTTRTGAYTVPFGVTRLGGYAFEDTGLSALTLSDSLVSVGPGSLSSAHLTSLVARTAIPPATEADPFARTSAATCHLTVPAGADDAYRAAPFWQKFYGIESGIHDATTPAASVVPRIYDLQGRRVSTPRAGLYVVGGKKVLIP